MKTFGNNAKEYFDEVDKEIKTFGKHSLVIHTNHGTQIPGFERRCP